MTGILSMLIGQIYGGSTPVTSDPYYEYTTLLLPGNGTNGAQNNTFLDSSTNNFTITRNGNTTQGTFSPFSQTGWGNYFNGSSQYLSVANNAAFDFAAGDFTIEAFVYPTTASQLAFVARTETQGFVGFICSTTNFLASTNGSSWNISITFTNALTANAWNHVAIVRNGDVYTAYKNGDANGTTTVSGTILSGSAALVVGRRSGQTDFSGYISNLRLVKGRAVYTSAFTPPTSPLTRTTGGTNPPQGTETSLLTCQSNRFLDSNGVNIPASSPLTITVNGNTSVQAFSPFNPSASWSAATYGGSGYFDGSGDYLQGPVNSAFAFGTGEYCMEGWIYMTSAPASPSGLIDLRRAAPNYNAPWLNVTSGYKLALRDGTLGVDVVTGATNIQLNTWTHVAVTRQVTSNAGTRIFLNGVLDANSITNNSNYSNGALTLATAGDSLGNYMFTGYMSDVRITKGSVPTSYQTSATTSGTVVFTPPTSPETTTSQGASSPSILLNYTNAGIYDATSKNDLETVADAKISTAVNNPFGASTGVMAFDGTGDWLVAYGSLADLSNFGAGNFTIETWVRFSDLSGLRCFCGKWGGASNRGWIFSYEANALYFSYSTTGTNATDVTGSWTPSINTWYYIAVIRNGADLKLYVDGSQKGTTHNISTSSIYASTSVLSVAQRGDNVGLLNGYLQDLRITKGYARDVTVVPTAAFPTL